MRKSTPFLCALLLAGGQAALAQGVPEEGRSTARPTTRPAAADVDVDDNPFILADVPASTRAAVKPDAVVRFSVVDGYLFAQTTLPPSEPQMQKVEGLPTPVHVQVTHRSGKTAENGEYYAPDMLQISYVGKEGTRWVRTSISTVINHMSLSRDSIAEGNEHTVQYIQSMQPNMAGTGASLYVQSLMPETIDQKQTYTAENFAAFIRKYPAQTTQYLRPIIEVLGPQPHLFAVDDALACTVFPEAFAANEARRAEILLLVQQLDDDDFRTRQQATASLEKMGVAATAVLASLDRGAMPPEQAARVDGIISRIKPPYDVDVKVLRNDPGFLLDCLLSQDQAVRKAAASQLARITGARIELPDGDDETSRVHAVYELRAKLLANAPTTQASAN